MIALPLLDDILILLVTMTTSCTYSAAARSRRPRSMICGGSTCLRASGTGCSPVEAIHLPRPVLVLYRTNCVWSCSGDSLNRRPILSIRRGVCSTNCTFTISTRITGRRSVRPPVLPP
uniref:Secreted protein n=1 Tax=Cacopsylla melanoneura TaxID=428564 RepID=A0A8D8PRF3_9HEMI